MHETREPMDLRDYLPETLRQDGEFILYRGRHRRPGEAGPPTILLLTPLAERPAPASLRRMEQEYSLRAELDPGWAAQPLALVSHNGRMVLVLADPGGEPLDRLPSSPLELTPCLRLAVGLSASLGRLHARGLIHKDIKPANVLVHGASGQVWLTGFAIASRLRRERHAAEPPEFIAGTLPYMAPEQTGRMNRSVDSRSDLYALGVTLYELLTGSLPFTASDPMEWVHCHIAKRPVPPAERRKDVPRSVSAIIMKLLAKTAEDRYQTAAGVESDLRRCLAQWEAGRRIDEFPLGEHDTPDRLLIPEKLYGREREVETLLASFDRIVTSGSPELVLVSGYSGIGKSSVVNELHRVLVPPRGLFAAGKFDQYKRDIPYSTLAQAFQGLVRPLLGKSDTELGGWRDALREALGPNGRLMIDLVPELKLIIGEQPPVPELPAQDAQRRFQLVFRRFIGVFARPEHPLALFLDDLQWLDAATLDLLEALLTGSDLQHLMLIGAYRDNEVTAAHPLMRKLDAIKTAGGKVAEITLARLACEHLGQLIADALRCESERAAPLAQRVHEKTGGNPFFAIQFISSLAEEKMLTFDHGAARWSWDLDRIHAKGYTDNVADLMVGKVTRLPAETQTALQQLACLGNTAEIKTLSLVLGTSEEQVHAALWPAVRQELVERPAGACRFVHDRVQEAAYSLIPEALRGEAHLRIGRLLAAHIPAEKREEAIFEIVNQLNRGSQLITSAEERKRLAELNLLAGRRAKISTAYSSALSYLGAARAFLNEESWGEDYELIFSIEYDTAECELLTADMVAAENRLSMLAHRAKGGHDAAVVTRLRLTLYQTLDRSDRAVEVCLEYLRRSGTDWPSRPTLDEVRREYDRIWSQLGGRQIEELIDLPLMTNPDVIDDMDVLGEVVTPAKCYDLNLLSLVACRMVNLSLEHGNSDGSCFAYVWFAIVSGPCFGNYSDGFRFGRLGYELVEKRGLTFYQARTYMCFANIVMPWANHARTGRDLIHRAFEVANRIGDLTFTAYCRDELISNFLTVGDPLAEVQHQAEDALAFVRKLRFGLIVDIIVGQVAFIRALRGLTPKFGCFNDEGFHELEFERHLASAPALMLADFWYCVRKAQARFIAGDFGSAVEASLRAERLLWTSPSQFETAELRFYGALSHAASWDSASPDQRQQHFEALAAHHRQIEIWAENCPENFENRAALVGAEIARIEGRELEAEHSYEQAIRSARANGFVHNEAVANEVAARFYAARGFETTARAYLKEARYCYLRWGADGKVRQLDQLHPQLREEQPVAGPRSTIGTPVEHLDLATVLKISQAVSGEIVLENLIDALLRTALEHAGAERGLLILPQDGDFRIAAEADTNAGAVTVRLRESAPVTDLPEAVVQYAARTQEPVLLDDASAPGPFSSDDYIRRQHARSVLCLPLIKQGRLVALLYLENNLAAGVFTPARIAVLNVLASGAAISLENTRLYRDLEEREAKIRRLVDANIIGIFIWRLDGEILEANEAFLHTVGYDRADLASGRLRWTELTPAECLDRDLQQFVPELKSRGSLQPFEKEYLRKDGSRVPVLVGIAAFDKECSQGVAFVVDLTERKRAEEEHTRMLRAEAENRAKEEFLADVSHEIRTPMTAILGMTELVLDTPLTEDQRQCLRTVKSAADNLLGIINDLLDFAKIEAGKLALDHRDFSLRLAVGNTLRALAARAHRKGLELVCQVQPDVSDALIGDAGRLRQVLLNLVGNAIKFTEKGEVVVLVEEEAAAESAGRQEVVLRFSVRDTGIGIPKDQQERIFRAFEQEDASTTRRYGGTGLGLTIAARLAALMGGQIRVTSAPGQGSTFTFSARVGLQPHPAEPTAAEPPALLRNLPVLIIDDNATNRNILCEWLHGWQMDPAAAGDGVEAMGALWEAAARGRPYALVLLDARMPDTDGLALAAQIRKRTELSATRIIFLLSSGDRPGDWDGFRELRIEAHLLKPIQQDELLDKIYQVMSRAKDDEPKEAGPVAGRELHTAPPPAATPLHILLAEDDEFSARFIVQLFARGSHRVRLTTNGREALSLAEEGVFDLLLLDIHMPELDGFGVVAAIRERERAKGGHLPVIALTARSRKEDRERCLAAGMDDFLTKPVATGALLAAIDRLVSSHEVSKPPQAEAGPSGSLLDPVAVLTACGDDAEGLRRMCEDFQTYAPARLAEVGEALRELDAPGLRQAAHKFCPLLFAFSPVAGNVASDLEDYAAQGQLEEAQRLVERLETMTQALMRLVGGLSLETLRQQARAADEPRGSAGH